MALLKKNTLICAAYETTEGTAAAIDPATHAVYLVQDVTFKPEIQKIDRNIMGPTFAKKRSLVAQKLARVTFKTEMVGSGVVDTAPKWADFLYACGFSRTVNVATSVVFNPVTNPAWGSDQYSGGRTLTIWVYQDGMIKKIRGARGTFKLSGDAANIAHIEWDFLGIYVGTSDAAFPPLLAGYDSQTPPLVESASMTFFSMTTAMLIKTFSIDIGNNIGPRFDANAASGIKSIIIQDRSVTGEIDPEQTLVATYDPLASLMGATIGNFTISVGATAGNRIVISAPSGEVQVVDVSENDRDGIRTNSLSLEFHTPMIEDSTNKEIRITHS